MRKVNIILLAPFKDIKTKLIVVGINLEVQSPINKVNLMNINIFFFRGKCKESFCLFENVKVFFCFAKDAKNSRIIINTTKFSH